MSFKKLFIKSYQILTYSTPDSLEQAFHEECELREKFNIDCIEFVETACKNINAKNKLPEEYSTSAIVMEIVQSFLVTHRKKRVLFLNISKTLLKPLNYILRFKQSFINRREQSLFVKISILHLLIYSIKRIIINMIRVGFKLDIKPKIKSDLKNKSYIICADFPWHAFVKQTKDTNNNQYETTNNYSSLIDYLVSAGEVESREVISINEYEQAIWNSSTELHSESLFSRYRSYRYLAPPLYALKQTINQLPNIKNALNVYIQLNVKGFMNNVFILFGILKYFTDYPEIYGFIKNYSKDNSLKLIINANNFYCFPWWAHMVSDKKHYMYADNCCNFPFAYFSPSNEFKHLPVLNESSKLMFGFLEWPIYFRDIGKHDLGYKGVSRLSTSLLNFKKPQKNVLEKDESTPLQLGAIKAFSKLASTEQKELSSIKYKKKRILFLDAKSLYPERQYLQLDVPNVFLSPEVAEHYYQCFISIAEENDVTVVIRGKHVIGDALSSVIKKNLNESNSEKDSIVAISPLMPLQDAIFSVNPDILLIRPVSSTHLFVEHLGFKPYYFIPDTIIKIFNGMGSYYGSSTFDRDQWISEYDVLDLLGC